MVRREEFNYQIPGSASTVGYQMDGDQIAASVSMCMLMMHNESIEFAYCVSNPAERRIEYYWEKPRVDMTMTDYVAKYGW